MCACRPGSPQDLGLYQEKRGEQVKVGDSAPLLRSHQTPPAGLHSALEPLTEEGHGCVGAGPEDGHEDDQRAGVPLVRGQAKTSEVVQPREEKAAG